MLDVTSGTADSNAKSFVNDNAKPATALTTAAFLASAEQQRVAWETGVYVEANKQLYAVLARCYEFVMKDNGESEIARSKALAEFYAKPGYTYKQKTPFASRIVRAVFGNVDRRRISTYSIVIRKAQQDKIEVEDFAAWVENGGGVQEVRLGRSENYVSKKDKAERVSTKWDMMQTLGVASDERLRLQSKGEHAHAHCLLVALQNKDGTYTIKGVVHTKGIVQQAMAAMQSAVNAVESSVAKAKLKLDKEAANDAQLKDAA